MSTTMVESWAVDLANVGPIYPMVGTEGILVIIGVAFWIIWHIWQMKHENSTYNEEQQKLKDPATLGRAMRNGRLD